MKNNIYFTTPIYYVNDTPHIGHAYTTVVTDILTRYFKLFGYQTYFLTGTDEHGQKVQNKAKELQRDCQDYVDEMVTRFKDVWRELDIEYNQFIRTTAPFHKKGVQKALQTLFDKGELYSTEYQGQYCVSEEIFYTEKDVNNGRCPQGHSVQLISEKNYFFKMSKYQERLVDYIQKNPSFVQPDFRRNEVLGFLKKPLEDLCISRPKNRLSWGIELPFDTDYVTYVWFDALLNYCTALGYGQGQGEISPAKNGEFETFWTQCHHILGKDILNTHAVYWPCMLMALEVPLPATIFAHGWWLTESNEKMSKSSGPVVKPLDMKDLVGKDSLRYFLARDIFFGNDAQFSSDLVVHRVNSELSNNLGNLLSRTLNLVEKYFNSSVPNIEHPRPDSIEIAKKVATHVQNLKSELLLFRLNLAIGEVVELLNHANRFLEQRAPWKSAKLDLDDAADALYVALECLRISATLLYPVMPSKMLDLLKRIGWEKPPQYTDALHWGLLKPGTRVVKGEILFPRVEMPN